jgi:hypothetical protein
MTFRKSIPLLISLSMIAALVACGGSSHTTTTTTPVVAITATSGTPQSVAVGQAFAVLTATVTTNGAPTSGVSVTFTAPATTDGTFASNSTATETDATNSSGVATSSVFTAGTAAGTYTVAATVSGVPTPANFVLTNLAGAPTTLAISSGNNQTVNISKAFAPLVAKVTDADGNPVQGINVSFTINAGSTGASGTFTGGTNAEAVLTDANGNATVSDLVANATAGAFTVTASSTSLTSVNFTETNTTVVASGPLTPNSNYTFSLTGADANGFYTVAGTFSVGSDGATITQGEQDFSDFNIFATDLISGGSAVTSSNGNVIITLTTCAATNCTSTDTSIGVSGVETLDATLISSSKALVIEFDSSASSSGELDIQATNLVTPTGGFAFYITGLDANGSPISIGGVIDVDSAGGISGNHSIFDVNDDSSLSPLQPFTASTVQGPDQYGLVTFTLNSSFYGSPGIVVDGYMVDANHIRLVENFLVDNLSGTTGGFARAQTGTGSFSTASISGSSHVFGTAGSDFVSGAQQVAGVLTFNANGTVSGNLSYNDLTFQNAQGGSTLAAGTYTIDPSGTGIDGGTGRVTVTGLADSTTSPTFTYNLQLYLTGDGHATVISMDSADILAGQSVQQASGSFTAASFDGSYAFNVGQVVLSGTSLFEQDGVGPVAAGGVGGTLNGFLDVNESGTPVTDLALSGNFAVSSTNSVFTGTTTDPVFGGSDLFTYYLVDTTSVVAFENDNFQLTLGLFDLQ